MTYLSKPVPDGWATIWLGGPPIRHFFVNARSLCGKRRNVTTNQTANGIPEAATRECKSCKSVRLSLKPLTKGA